MANIRFKDKPESTISLHDNVGFPFQDQSNNDGHIKFSNLKKLIGDMLKGLTLYVDSVNGNDSTALRGIEGKPYLTITAAKNAASSGDLIIIGPGTYIENNLLKAGINYHFMPGAKVEYTDNWISTSTTSVAIGTGAKTFTVAAGLGLQAGDPIFISLQPNTIDPDVGGSDPYYNNLNGTVTSYTGTTLVANISFANGSGTYAKWHIFKTTYAIFDDRPIGAAGICRVSGDGEFKFLSSNPPNAFQVGTIHLQSVSSDMSFTASKVLISGPAYGGTNGKFAALHVKDCLLSKFYVAEISDTHETWSDLNALEPQQVNSVAGAIFWEKGEMHVNFNLAQVDGGYALWCDEPAGSPNTNLYLEGKVLKSSAQNTFYISSTTSLNYRIWIDCTQIICPLGYALSLIGPAKVYIDSQKISGFVVANLSAGIELWLRAEKVSMSGPGGSWFQISNSTVYLTVQEYEDAGGSVSHGIDVSGTSYVEINGGRIKTGVNSFGSCIRHQGGTTRAKNLTIDGSAGDHSTNRPIVVAGAGLILEGCTIIGCATTDGSIYAASAQTVKLYNDSYSNKAKHLNVTLQANLGTLVRDDAVT